MMRSALCGYDRQRHRKGVKRHAQHSKQIRKDSIKMKGSRLAMIFGCLILGCILIACALSLWFAPVVDEETIRQESIQPITTSERPIMISEIIKVEVPSGEPPTNDFEEVEIVKPEYIYYDVPLSDEVQEYITDQCLEKFGALELYGVNLPKLVINIIRWESGFNPDNDNGKCCGYMSVTRNLSKSIIEGEDITDLLDWRQNLRAGIHILKNQYDIYLNSGIVYKHPMPYIVNSYHTGELEPLSFDYIDNIFVSYNTTAERK